MLTVPPLPEDLHQRLLDCYPQAHTWLAEWPQRLRQVCQDWCITHLEWVNDLSYHPVFWVHYTAPTHPQSRKAVLKLIPPGAGARAEMAALNCYQGQNACAVLAQDHAGSALLLEGLHPGTPLKALLTHPPHTPGALQQDAHATRQAAELMQKLWQCQANAGQQSELISLEQWTLSLKRLRPQNHPLPTEFLQQAETWLQELAPRRSPVLLHGDLHHGNILSHTRGAESVFLAIDPKGLWGNPGYEVGSFLCNPTSFLQALAPQGLLEQVLAHRLAIFSEVFEMPFQELAQWGFIYSILSACWSFEDHGEHDVFAMTLAQTLLQVIS